MKGKLRSPTGAATGTAGMLSKRKQTRACSGPMYGRITSTLLTGPALSATSRAKQPLSAGHTKLFLCLPGMNHEENPAALRGFRALMLKENTPLFTQAITTPGGISRKYQRHL